jgi:hypothetical protein
MNRKTTEIEPMAPVSGAEVHSQAPAARSTPATERAIADEIRRHGEDLENRYVAARDAWTRAMRTASSGKPADMASLAIAQEAYEAVTEEREHWLAGGKIVIPIERDPEHHDIEVAVGQELEWRRVLAPPKKPGFFGRIRRRLGGR